MERMQKIAERSLKSCIQWNAIGSDYFYIAPYKSNDEENRNTHNIFWFFFIFQNIFRMKNKSNVTQEFFPKWENAVLRN